MTKFDDLWTSLSENATQRSEQRIDELFKADPQRLDALTVSACGIYADLSKNLMATSDLQQLAEASLLRGVGEKIQAMFDGEPINETEQRAVLHTLLRYRPNSFPDRSKVEAVEAALAQIKSFVGQAHEGNLGYRVKDVVNVGIGGSHLGPAMVCNALRDFRVNDIKTHFVSNVDASLLQDILRELQPETTLFIIGSKSFTTAETLLNATTIREWFEQQSGGKLKVSDHFAAVSSAIDKVIDFGITEENIFPMWDWVGGRYSLWSAIGLPIALQCGYDHFEALLNGAAAMDWHFLDTPTLQNLPAMLALSGIWQSNFLDASSRAVIPYDDRLSLLPAFLQQLEMESNGKQVDCNGEAVEFDTSPVVWGGVGTDAQHAFFQQLHQGTTEVPIDFIVCKKPGHQHAPHHQSLIANCLAQAEALMNGTRDETDPARLMLGNHSSNMLVMDELTPASLGALIALYEHRTMFQGAWWGINSFDQFGVELGKKLAKTIEEEFNSGHIGEHDPSTTSLLKYVLD